MSLRCPRPINPILLMNRAAHRVFQRVAPNKCAVSSGVGEQECFRVVSVTIGDPSPERAVICFNEDPNNGLCSPVVPTSGFGFEFKSNGITVTNQSYTNPVGQDCMEFVCDMVIAGDGISNEDRVTLDYVPGECQKQGDAECALEAFTNRSVANKILGIQSMNVGNVADNVVEITMTAEAATVGNEWNVTINSGAASISGSSIVNGKIRLQLSTTPVDGDVVEVDHQDTAPNPATSTDGRILYVFSDYLAENQIDNTPPSVPQNLVATATGQQTINLTWDASTDAKSGVKGYNVFRNDGDFEYRFVDDRIDLPIPSLDGTTPGRIEVTVRPDDFRGGENQVIFEGNGQDWFRCFYFADDETYRFRAFSNDNTISSYEIDVQGPNQVTHICRWRANSGGSIYEVGGETDNGISGGSNPPHTTLYIGRRLNGLAPFKGVIKEIKYYNLAYGGTLVHYWKINDNSTTIADSAGTADGTLVAGSGSWQGGPIAFVDHPTTEYDDSGLDAETTYTYTVSAVDNRNNESAKSASDSATTWAPAPNVTAAEVGNVADDIVVVTFDREVVATNYTTGWSFTENGSGRSIQSSAKTAATEVRFTLTSDITEGTTVAYNYNAASGNYENTDGVDMENQSGSVTNNVGAAVPDFEAFTVDNDGVIKALKTGTGSVTFARSTEATVKDFYGRTLQAREDELRVQNRRRVENLCVASPSAQGGATVEDLGNREYRFGGFTSSTSQRANYLNSIPPNTEGRDFRYRIALKGEGANIGKDIRVELRRFTGGSDPAFAITATLQSEYVTFAYPSVITGLPGNNGWQLRVSGVGANFATGCLAKEDQIEEVTGLTDKNPSEFASQIQDNGVYAPYVKVFNYEKNITVDSGTNILDESGNPGPDLTGDFYFLFEPAATNYADGADDLSGGSETVDLTAGGTGDYTLSVEGTAAVTVAAGTAIGTGFGQATEGNPVTFNLTGAGTVTLTLDSGTLDKVNGLAVKQVEKNSYATSWIPSDGGTANRTADDGDPMFSNANWNQPSGTWYATIVFLGNPTVSVAMFTTGGGNRGQLYFKSNEDIATRDEAGNTSDRGSIIAGNVNNVAITFSTGNDMNVGFEDLTADPGNWKWDGSPATYGGTYVITNDIRVAPQFPQQNMTLKVRNAKGFYDDKGKQWVEDNV